MLEFVSSLRTRLTAVLLLAAFAFPLAAAADDCHDYCNGLSLDVLEGTGNRALADLVYDECVEEQCEA